MTDVTSNIVLTHLTSSAFVVYGMQRLKSAKWFPLVQEGKAILNRTFSLISAFCISIGISYQWNKAPDGSHTLVLAIPGLTALAIGAWHVANQFALQEVIYQGTIGKSPTEVVKGGS